MSQSASRGKGRERNMQKMHQKMTIYKVREDSKLETDQNRKRVTPSPRIARGKEGLGEENKCRTIVMASMNLGSSASCATTGNDC